MAARAIIGTAPREFPLGGTVSYSNWIFQLLAHVSDGLLDKRPFWMVGCMSAPKVGVDGSRGWRPYSSPRRILRQPRSPRGRRKAHGGGLQLLNGTSQGRPAGMAAHSCTSPSEATSTV